MKLYAFDVDDTLEISKGPVTISMVRELREAGHIVGICGNWVPLVTQFPSWHHVVSFLSPLPGTAKERWLTELKKQIKADDYVFVGNDGSHGSYNDKNAAGKTGWRWVKESDFAAGAR